jgi:hypothetical protein
MKVARFTRLMLQPTTGGLFGLAGLSIFIMVFAGLSYTTRHDLFYQYLFGPGSSVELIESSRSTIAAFNEAVFGNPVLNKILFFAFWMVIGLVVYVILIGLGSGLSVAERAVEELRFVHAQKDRITSELGIRVVLALLALGLGIIYLVLLFRVLLPFGVLCARIVAGDPGMTSVWGYGILGFLVLSGSLYFGMVLLRFLMLRPRIFGSVEDIVTDEIEHEEE